MENGVYKFDGSKLAEYHAANKARFEKALSEGKPVVICDNVNSRANHYLDYVKIARRYNDYTIIVVSMPHMNPAELFRRCTHKVPLHSIERMLREWEE